MTEQEIKYKIAVAMASRQPTEYGINEATDIIYKLFKEQLFLSIVIKRRELLIAYCTHILDECTDDDKSTINFFLRV